ncbi:MAG TPA: ABC transporter permease [Acidimicrobiales bacterium]|jgi:ABC-2 type transport system permease protein/oleandomycin transport system permease protein|nr:ABC transporter permease [Acidimicrobiales bacterium]
MTGRLRWAVLDSWTMVERNVILWLRVPAYIMFTIVQPLMFMVLFKYVFGGAIAVGTKGGYVDFLMPGVIGQTAAFTSFSTAIALAKEIQQGSIDRFRSMPMARSAVLVGRLGADLLRLLLTIAVLLLVGYAVGFRFHNGLGPAVLMVILALAIGLGMATISAFTGLAIKDEESVQAFGLIWVFPLTFVSAAFVPINTMPGWLQAFANNQPITIFIDELRNLAIGGPLWLHLWQSALWLLGIFIVFGTLAVRAYRRV